MAKQEDGFNISKMGEQSLPPRPIESQPAQAAESLPLDDTDLQALKALFGSDKLEYPMSAGIEYEKNYPGLIKAFEGPISLEFNHVVHKNGTMTLSFTVVARHTGDPGRELKDSDFILLNYEERGDSDPDIFIGTTKGDSLEFNVPNRPFYYLVFRDEEKRFERLMFKFHNGW